MVQFFMLIGAGLAVALIVAVAIASCVIGAAFDREFDSLTPDGLQAKYEAERQAEKSQLIVSAMKRDREAAFAAHTGSAFGEVPRVPQEGA